MIEELYYSTVKRTKRKEEDSVTQRVKQEHTTLVNQPFKVNLSKYIDILYLCGVEHDYSHRIIC